MSSPGIWHLHVVSPSSTRPRRRPRRQDVLGAFYAFRDTCLPCHFRLQEHDKEKGRELTEEEEAQVSEEDSEWEKVRIKDGNQAAAENPVEKAGLRDGGFSTRKGYGQD